MDQPLRHLGAVGACVLVVATAGAGGLEPQAQDGPEVVAAGTAVDAAPFEITVRRARWADDLGVPTAQDGDRWVAVVATVRNTSDASVLSSHLTHALTLEPFTGARATAGEHGLAASATALLDDGSTPNPVQPGLTQDVVFLFDQDGGAAPPDEVVVHLQRSTWREGSLDRSLAWWEPTTVAEAPLPVEAAPDPAAPDDPAPDRTAQDDA